jgi:type II secretory ATPase GspE/PulE/Tfp pilus assembly ATPase PilB-like protein
VTVATPGPPVPRRAIPVEFKLETREPGDTISALLEHAAKLRASDLFLYANEDHYTVAIRHLGIVRPVGRLPAEFGRRCLSFIKAAANMNISERRRPMDGRWLYTRKTQSALDLRVSTLPTLHGEDCTTRILDQDNRLLSLDQLGMDADHLEQFRDLLACPSGLILVTGPTESGKSTTLYAAIEHLNDGETKINTIEDPIEYSIAGIRQTQVNLELDLHFESLLRHVLRQAPDVIMIGEIRDAETAQTAVQAAGSGHLVLSTLHAPVAAAAVHSLLRLDVHANLLSNSLIGVISQRLLRTLCPSCKHTYPLAEATVSEWVRHWLATNNITSLAAADGCESCGNMGYSGRTGVFEVLPVGAAIRELIDSAAGVPAIRRQAVTDGMREFRHAAAAKLAQGTTSLEEVFRMLPAEYLRA